MLKTDRVRALLVLVCAVAGFAVRFVPGLDLRGVTHALSASGSRLAPSPAAFLLDWWLAIAMVAYAVWQVRARQLRRPIHRRIGWFAPAVAFVDAAWPLVLAAHWPLAVRLAVVSGLLLALVAVLTIVVARINGSPDLVHVDLYLLDATFGLHLGWTTVLAGTAIAALLRSLGFDPTWWVATICACGALVVLAALVTGWCFWLGDRVAVALATAWGLAWIAVARLTGSPHSWAVAGVAILGALHVLGFTRWRRHTRNPRPVAPAR